MPDGILGRRVARLEATVEEARLRPYKQFAADHDLNLDELLAEVEVRLAEVEVRLAEVDRFRAEGTPPDAIMARIAERWGYPLAELAPRAEAIARRYFS